tara:strand:+ start:35 stop:559 length:525 start_codon:yes stop_codon:yes gene_type:complete
MSINVPTELNYLKANAFETNFIRLPDTNFTCTEVTIPSMALGLTTYQSLFSDIPIEGDKINFEQLSISFIVSEDFSNYLEIYNWLISIGFPEKFEQFSLKESLAQSTSTSGLRSDMSIIINTNKSNPNYEITFKDAFPVSLGSITFGSNVTSVEPISVSATFAYAGQFNINKIT